jgi:hypothetical protein
MSEANLTDGTISIDKLSVNTNLGFSIVSYNGNQVSNATVAHGLGVKPELIIVKNLDISVAWAVWTTGISDSEVLRLEQTAAATTPATAYFEPQNNTSNVFSLGTNDETNYNYDYIAYCFASKRGVSKVGSYTGTGAAGNKVYTGFEPAFIMTKRSSSAGDNWNIIDNVRDTDPDKNSYLRANLNSAEVNSSTSITFNKDGFTLNGGSFNTSSQTHIYYAVAKNTNETSLIPDTDLELHIDLGDSSCYSGSGTTVNDLSSNSHTVTTLAGVQEADFDKEVGGFLTVKENSNEGLTIADHADFDHTNGATYEGWVYLDSNGTSEETFLWRGPSSSGAGLRIYWHASYGWFPRDFNASSSEIIDQNNIKTGPSGFGRGKWYHLALTLSSASAATYKFYVDGNLIGSYTASGGGQNSLSYGISLGKYVGGGVTDLHGKIGQFRLYSSALTQDQIRQNYNFTKPNYPNGFDGTITSSTWNSGGYFDVSGASNSGIEIEELTTQITPNGNDSTMGGWFRKDNTNWGTFWSKGYSTNYELQAAEGGGNNLRYIFYRKSGSSVAVAETNSSLSANTWYHIMGVIDWRNQDVKIYLNGSLVGTNTTWTHYTSNQYLTGSVFIGRRNDNSGNLDGKVSAFKVYDRVLDTSEITALFDDEKANYGY